MKTRINYNGGLLNSGTVKAVPLSRRQIMLLGNFASFFENAGFKVVRRSFVNSKVREEICIAWSMYKFTKPQKIKKLRELLTARIERQQRLNNLPDNNRRARNRFGEAISDAPAELDDIPTSDVELENVGALSERPPVSIPQPTEILLQPEVDGDPFDARPLRRRVSNTVRRHQERYDLRARINALTDAHNSARLDAIRGRLFVDGATSMNMRSWGTASVFIPQWFVMNAIRQTSGQDYRENAARAWVLRHYFPLFQNYLEVDNFAAEFVLGISVLPADRLAMITEVMDRFLNDSNFIHEYNQWEYEILNAFPANYGQQ